MTEHRYSVETGTEGEATAMRKTQEINQGRGHLFDLETLWSMAEHLGTPEIQKAFGDRGYRASVHAHDGSVIRGRESKDPRASLEDAIRKTELMVTGQGEKAT